MFLFVTKACWWPGFCRKGLSFSPVLDLTHSFETVLPHYDLLLGNASHKILSFLQRAWLHLLCFVNFQQPYLSASFILTSSHSVHILFTIQNDISPWCAHVSYSPVNGRMLDQWNVYVCMYICLYVCALCSEHCHVECFVTGEYLICHPFA
jgi:hypothetical protein